MGYLQVHGKSTHDADLQAVGRGESLQPNEKSHIPSRQTQTREINVNSTLFEKADL